MAADPAGPVQGHLVVREQLWRAGVHHPEELRAGSPADERIRVMMFTFPRPGERREDQKLARPLSLSPDCLTLSYPPGLLILGLQLTRSYLFASLS